MDAGSEMGKDDRKGLIEREELRAVAAADKATAARGVPYLVHERGREADGEANDATRSHGTSHGLAGKGDIRG